MAEFSGDNGGGKGHRRVISPPGEGFLSRLARIPTSPSRHSTACLLARGLCSRRGLKIRVGYSLLPCAPRQRQFNRGISPTFFLLCFRRVRVVGRGSHRIASGEVAVRARGVLQDPIPEPADEIRQAVAEAALPEDGLVPGDRAAVLRAPGRENADRDADQGHAAQRKQLQLALHVHDVTHRLATLGFRVIGTPPTTPSPRVITR